MEVPYPTSTCSTYFVVFFAAVVFANVHLFLHFDAYPWLLNVAIITLGIMYVIGVPWGLYLHWNQFAKVRWEDDSLTLKVYFARERRETTVRWSDLNSITIAVLDVRQATISEAIKAIERMRSPLGVTMKIVTKEARAIEITSKMFTKAQNLRILRTIQRLAPAVSECRVVLEAVS